MKLLMKNACILLVICLLPSINAYAARGLKVAPISPVGKEVKGDNWLFVIGIDTYIKWPRLETAVNDAKSVKNVLLSRYHFDKKYLIELYDEQATRRNIIKKLRHLAQKVDGDDSLVIFYAGHGHLDSITKEGSWIPVESDTENSAAWITNHDIRNYLKVDVIKAKHILLVSDSCFSGDFFRGRRGKLPKVTSAVIKKAWQLTSRQAITSGGLEPVSDAGFGNNSVFSHFLINALKKNTRPFLVPSELFPDIKAGVAENAEQFPRFGSLKGTGGQQGGELVLFLKQVSKLKGLSDDARVKNKELERLKQLEAEEKQAKAKEDAEIAKRKREIAALDAKIVAMKKRLKTVTTTSDDDLDALFAAVRQKEQQQKRIDELKRKRKAEEEIRRAEIERLKAENLAKKVKILKEDISKYEKIVSSKFGKGMKESAWKSLVAKYPNTRGLEVGDTIGLKMALAGDFFNTLSMEFVYIKPGSFMMGSPSSDPGHESNELQHKVTLTKGFYMQTTEVTQGQWKAVMGNNPSRFKNCGDNCPVERVSWNDMQAFIRKLNRKEGTNRYRLPTEAEWEYAARAGSTTAFANGGISGLHLSPDSNLDAMGWYGINSYVSYSGCDDLSEWIGHNCAGPNPVAMKQPNAWGLYDMHGNVLEWCQDRFAENYPVSSVIDPTGPSSGPWRVLRGGGWNYIASWCRSAHREANEPGGHRNCDGFRLVLSPGQ